MSRRNFSKKKRKQLARLKINRRYGMLKNKNWILFANGFETFNDCCKKYTEAYHE